MRARRPAIPGEMIAALMVGSVGFSLATGLSLVDGSPTLATVLSAGMSAALALGAVAAVVLRRSA